jgi:hypothetical protein
MGSSEACATGPGVLSALAGPSCIGLARCSPDVRILSKPYTTSTEIILDLLVFSVYHLPWRTNSPARIQRLRLH